jgi:hypothetical protein
VAPVPTLPAVLLRVGVLVAYWPHEATASGPEAGMIKTVVTLVLDIVGAFVAFVALLAMSNLVLEGVVLSTADGILAASATSLAAGLLTWCTIHAVLDVMDLVGAQH